MGAIITFGNFTAPAGTWLEAERGRQDRRVLRPILIFGFPLSTRACVSWGSSPTSLLGLGIRRLLRRDFRIRETHCCIECLFLVSFGGIEGFCVPGCWSRGCDSCGGGLLSTRVCGLNRLVEELVVLIFNFEDIR